MELDTDFEAKTLLYSVWYSVTGEAERSTEIQLSADATAKILLPNKELLPSAEHDDHHFPICLDICLPWELDEEIDQLKPAKQKFRLKRIADWFKK